MSYKDQLKEFETVLDQYKSTIGLHQNKYNSEVEFALNLTRDQINAMTAEDCAVYKFLLEQYAWVLQREYNTNNMRVEWATTRLNLIIGKESEKYGTTEENRFVKYELMRSKIILNNEAARALDEIIKHAGARATELKDLSNKAAFLGKSLYDIRSMKIENKKT